MPKISMTTFADFVYASGTARLTKAKQAKQQYSEVYAPERDYYKALRERIVTAVRRGFSAERLKKLLRTVDDPKKLENYEICRKGFTKWAGKKKLKLLPERRSVWKNGDLEVVVNPEMIVEVNGEPHAIKLYMKGEPLSKQKANVILHLIEKEIGKDFVPAVLDVRQAKLFCPTKEIDGLDALLQSEALAFESLLKSV